MTTSIIPGWVEVVREEHSRSIVAFPSTAQSPFLLHITQAPQNPRVLIVDDNRDLLLFLERLLQQAGWELLTALSAAQAREIFARERPSTVLLDYMLGDDDGVRLALQFQTQAPQTQVIIMTGGQLPPEDETICQARDIPILRKPFLGNDVLALIRTRLTRVSSAPRRTF